MTISGTTTTDIIYIQTSTGGVGLTGIEELPSLRASILGISHLSSEETLAAFIRGFDLSQTNYLPGGIIYASFPQTSFGLYGLLQSPDLIGYIETDLSRSGSGSLQAVVMAQRSGEGTLVAGIRPTYSGTDSLLASISGAFKSELLGYIRTSIAGSSSIAGFIEPIPPVDLYALVSGYAYEYLTAVIESIPPEDLLASISGVVYRDLLSNIVGSYRDEVVATYSGYFSSGLQAKIGIRDTKDLATRYRAFQETEATHDVGGYIKPAAAGTQTLLSSISGVYWKDLSGNVYGITTSGQEALYGVYSGTIDGILIASIEGAGGLKDLSAKVTCTTSGSRELIANINGYSDSYLYAEINPDTGSVLYANILPSGPFGNYPLLATISGFKVTDLLGQYEVDTTGLISGAITPIPPADLYASIAPKVFYIDSSLPINTYPFEELRAVINLSECQTTGAFEDLAVIISGNNATSLEAKVVSIAGQLSLAQDRVSVNLKYPSLSEDWLLFILQSPALYSTKLPLFVTNSPLADLFASITAVQCSSDLTAAINALYTPAIPKSGLPLAEWVNTKTGETKFVNVYFEGSVSDFYYSSEANTVYPGNAGDSLEIVVETFQREGEVTLLSRKLNVKKCKINNISNFSTIDAAIRFGIMYAASEISADLTVEITGVGGSTDLRSTISGIDGTFLSSLYSSYSPTYQAPTISGEITGTGDVDDLISNISTLQTASNWVDISGTRYVTNLLPLSGTALYSVVLTPATINDTIHSYNTPDLTASVTGIAYSMIDATISGL